jgi:hypothetical protein
MRKAPLPGALWPAFSLNTSAADFVVVFCAHNRRGSAFGGDFARDRIA